MQWVYSPQPRIATFNYPHNWVKSRVFILLNDASCKLSLEAITRLTGLNYHSLAVLLPRWTRWGYVHQSVDRKRNVYTYSLSRRGRDFIDYRVPGDVRGTIIIRLKAHLKKIYCQGA